MVNTSDYLDKFIQWQICLTSCQSTLEPIGNSLREQCEAKIYGKGAIFKGMAHYLNNTTYGRKKYDPSIGVAPALWQGPDS